MWIITKIITNILFQWTFVLSNVNYYKDYYKHLKSHFNWLINVLTTSDEKINFKFDSRWFLESVSALSYCDRSEFHDQWSHENFAYVSMSWFIYQTFFCIYHQKSHDEASKKCRNEFVQKSFWWNQSVFYFELLICLESSIILVYNRLLHRQELKISWNIDRIWIYERKTYKRNFDESNREDSDETQHSSSYFDYYDWQCFKQYHLFLDSCQESEHHNELCECNFREKRWRRR